MPRFSANLSMLFGEHEFLDRFDAAARAGFKGVEYVGPYDHRAGGGRGAAEEERPDAGAVQPAGRRLGGASAASPCCPTASTSSAAASTRRSPTPRRSAARRSTASPASRRKASTAPCWRTSSSRIWNSRRSSLKEAGIRLLIEPINTRDIPGFFLNTSQAGARRSSTASARTISICNTTSTTCRSWRGISPVPSRPISAASRISRSRTIPAATSRGRARSTIPSSTSISTASATPAGSGAEYKPKAGTDEGLGWFQEFAGKGSAAA